jgi:hypothetical protein
VISHSESEALCCECFPKELARSRTSALSAFEFGFIPPTQIFDSANLFPVSDHIADSNCVAESLRQRERPSRPIQNIGTRSMNLRTNLLNQLAKNCLNDPIGNITGDSHNIVPRESCEHNERTSLSQLITWVKLKRAPGRQVGSCFALISFQSL